jgi:hypothetical protein
MTSRKKEYGKYLQSKDWKERRDFLRDWWGNKCVLCEKTENLHMHHLNYENLGKETNIDVMPLCKGCHLLAHRGKLKIWIFTQEEHDAFRKIEHIICDDNINYLTFIKSDVKKSDL